ncbi:mechanosensitive ion channel family protein [Capilliphycus salinus ALCB114379]|uniref:mechanosensitive ion channel family protein n=1 Tax=Capilliphycus salinus TaxID=2768948 RepID=UPI0039A55F91
MLLGYFLAQAADNTLEDASELLSEITTSKIIQAIIILAVAYVGMFAIDKLIHWLAEEVPLRFRLSVKQSLPFWRAFLLGLASILLIRLFLKLSSSNVLALTGTVAVALGFAFKDYISSVIAGIIALFERPYQVGDRVKIGDEYGEIVDYGLRGIRLQTPDDNVVSIPHNKIWTEAISNSNKGDVEAQVVANFYFEHSVDVDKVMKILYKVAYTSKYTQLMLPILVIMDEKPWGTNFKLKSYPIDARDEFIYKTDLIKRAKQTFAKQGISYPMLSAQSSELWEND